MTKNKRHKDNGMRCLVVHHDGLGNKVAQCFMCTYCHHWIRPDDVYMTCQVKQKQDEIKSIQGN